MTTPKDPHSDLRSADGDHLLLHAQLDDELDATAYLEIERRAATNAALAAEQARLGALRRALRQHVHKDKAPEHLRLRLLRDFGPPVRRTFDWRALAASMAVAAGLAGGVTYLTVATRPADVLAQTIIAAHQRGLLAAQPVDVASSDRHTVKPWLSGKLAVSPPVVELADQGFPLVGGRIDIVNGQPAPTLVYRRREHLVSLTVLPSGLSGSFATEEPRSYDGYTLLAWRAGGFSYWATSDVPLADLTIFADAYRKAANEM